MTFTFNPRDLARKIVHELGHADDRQVALYVQGYCISVGSVLPADVDDYDRLLKHTRQLVRTAKIHRVVVLEDEDTPEVQMSTCPYDCGGCHDLDDCECGSCRLWRRERDDE
jgi:hypothetical protein